MTLPISWPLWSAALNVLALLWFLYRPKRLIKVFNKPYHVVMGRVSAKWRQTIPYETKEFNDCRITVTQWDGKTHEFSIEEQYWNNCKVGETQIWVAT